MGRGGGGGGRAGASPGPIRRRLDREQARAARDDPDRTAARQAARSRSRSGPTPTPTARCRSSRPTTGLLALAELELTTDAEDPHHPGLIGNAYSYAPEVEATMLLAADASAVAGKARPGDRARAQAVARERSATSATTRSSPSATAELAIPAGGLPWRGPAYVNVVVSASHPEARSPATCCWSARTRRRPSSSRTWPGSGSCASARRRSRAPDAELESRLPAAAEIAIAKQHTVVLAHQLAGAREGRAAAREGPSGHRRDRLAGARSDLDPDVRRRLARIRSSPAEPPRPALTWKGQLSKFTGFNCIPAEGPQTSRKYGVAKVVAAPAGDLYVNLVAVSGAPFGGIARDGSAARSTPPAARSR